MDKFLTVVWRKVTLLPETASVERGVTRDGAHRKRLEDGCESFAFMSGMNTDDRVSARCPCREA